MSNPVLEAYGRFRLQFPIYYFHHLPKCGGTSVRKALDEWFYVNDDYHDEEGGKSAPPIDLSELNRNNCISGHFGHDGFFIDQRYPKVFNGFLAAQRFRVFMFLRDPLQMRCSLYRHELRTATSLHPDLASAIMPYDNFYARILNVDEQSWKKRLDRYYFVGLADELQSSFDLLAKLIDKPTIQLSVANSTIREGCSSVDSLTVAQKRKFRSENALDYAIYEYALRRMRSISGSE